MKKMGLIRNLICLLVCVAVLSGYTINAKAEEETVNTEEEIVSEESVYLIFPDSSSDLITRGAHYLIGSGFFTNHGGGYIATSAFVAATGIKDKVYVRAYLQKQTNSGWLTVYTISNTAYNSNYISASGGITVATGYNYRLYLIGSVTHGGDTESSSNISDSMMVY